MPSLEKKCRTFASRCHHPISILINWPQRYENLEIWKPRFILIWHCREQGKIRCLEYNLTSHLRLLHSLQIQINMNVVFLCWSTYLLYIIQHACKQKSPKTGQQISWHTSLRQHNLRLYISLHLMNPNRYAAPARNRKKATYHFRFIISPGF
jgi:hypothetical protein